ncbi:MAG TPA: hypothetical protein VH306_09860 [Gaiellaceae bacterium]|jgi:hypothetical protein
MQARGWPWFGAWLLAGALFALTLVGAASIGIFVLPFTLAAIWWAARRRGLGPEALGAVSGTGLTCVAIAILQAGPGGVDARPWLAVGLGLVALGGAPYALVRRRREPPLASGRG